MLKSYYTIFRLDLPDIKLQETSESLHQSRSLDISNLGSGEIASILPQQFSIDRQVLIAPPIALTTQSHSPNPGQMEPESIVHNSGTSRSANLSEVAEEIPIPELVQFTFLVYNNVA